MADKKAGNELKVEMQIGKNGISKALVEELKARLAKRRFVKVKVLAALKANRKLLAEKIALEVNASVEEVKGSTVVFHAHAREEGRAGKPVNKPF